MTKEHVTDGGRWSLKAGEHGSIVTARERTPGGVIQLHWRDVATGKRVSRYAATTSVRDARGRLLRRACDEVRREAEDLSDRIRRARLNADIEPMRLTLGQGFALYHDEEEGGLPDSLPARKHHKYARLFWEDRIGADTPWNVIPRNKVQAGVKFLRRQGKVPTAEKCVRCLRTVFRWLHEQAGHENLKDPTHGIKFEKIREGHEVRRPRYTTGELAALIQVAYEVDPRFRFALLWARDSGARSVALYRATRSMVDAVLEVPPPAGLARYGWALLPAVKGQGRALTFLTWTQRLEFVRATWRRWNGVQWVPGYLSDLELQWKLNGVEYPLIPGGNIPRSGVIRPGRLRPVSNMTLLHWLQEAEEAAGIEHVERRGWHGVRRTWADVTMAATDLDTVVAAGAWSDRDMPERVYLETIKYGRLERSREAQEIRDDG